MQITTLIENHAACSGEGLVAEHGLSLHIDHGGKQILFDTGASGSFAANALKLGIDLDRVDAAVLSHHHYDHGGGLEAFFAVNHHAPVYLRDPPEGEPYFKALSVVSRPIGLPGSLLDNFAERFVYLDAFTEILPSIFIFTKIPRQFDSPRGNRHIYLKQGKRYVHDSFSHELLMALRVKDGLVVLTACSHSGVLNMIQAVRDRFPQERIKAVIGGFHLLGIPLLNTLADSKTAVIDLGRALQELPVDRYWTGHCTGDRAFALLQRVLGDRLSALRTGARLTIAQE